MARSKQFDPEQALGAALQVFWERGYEAASVRTLGRRMGLGKASLYGAFGSKRQLFLAALARYQEQSLCQLAAGLQGSRSPRRALQATFAGLIDRLAAASTPQGCLCVSSALELAGHDPEVAAVLRAHNARLEAVFQHGLELGRAEGEFAQDLDVPAAARFLTCTLFGLIVLGMSAPGERVLRGAARVALSALDPPRRRSGGGEERA